MAIIIEGQSTCPVCKAPLGAEDFTAFPHFMANAKDPLFIFSDQGVHLSCQGTHPLGAKAIAFRDWFGRTLAEERRSYITGESNPKNRIAVSALTSDSEEVLYRFNFITLYKSEIGNWAEKNKFIEIAEQFLAEKKWQSLSPDFSLLEYLIQLAKDSLQNGQTG